MTEGCSLLYYYYFLKLLQLGKSIPENSKLKQCLFSLDKEVLSGGGEGGGWGLGRGEIRYEETCQENSLGAR